MPAASGFTATNVLNKTANDPLLTDVIKAGGSGSAGAGRPGACAPLGPGRHLGWGTGASGWRRCWQLPASAGGMLLTCIHAQPWAMWRLTEAAT
jgi:hypothetical protein